MSYQLTQTQTQHKPHKKLSYHKQIALHMCTQYVDGIYGSSVTLKSRLWVTEGRWEWHHWTDHIRLTISQVIKPPLATARAASRDGRVHLFVCLSPNCKNAIFAKTRFSQKLSNLELWCLLTTYRKSYIGFSKNPLLDP